MEMDVEKQKRERREGIERGSLAVRASKQDRTETIRIIKEQRGSRREEGKRGGHHCARDPT